MKSKSIFMTLLFLTTLLFTNIFGQDDEPGFQCGMKITDTRDGKIYSDAWFRYFKYSNTNVYREHYFKASSYSVRCLKDD